MKKLLVVGIITLFIGMSFIPTVASIQPEGVDTIETISNEKFNDTCWQLFIFGRIKNYDIIEVEGKEYILGMAIHLRSIVWNFFPKYPNIPFILPVIWQEFCIPYEWAKIIAPIPSGRYFLIAEGTTDI